MQYLRYILDYITESGTAILAGATCAGVLGTDNPNLVIQSDLARY